MAKQYTRLYHISVEGPLHEVLRAARGMKRHGQGRILSSHGGRLYWQHRTSSYSKTASTASLILTCSRRKHKLARRNARERGAKTSWTQLQYGGNSYREARGSKKWDWVQGGNVCPYCKTQTSVSRSAIWTNTVCKRCSKLSPIELLAMAGRW